MVADPPPAKPLSEPPPATPARPTPLRFLSYLLVALAVGVIGLAVLAYGFVSNMACGYSRSACGRGLSEMTYDDRRMFVGLPGLVVLALLWGAFVAYRRSR